MKKKKKINNFIKTRVKIESIIWKYDYLMQQIHRKYRGAQASFPHVANFLLRAVDLLVENHLSEEDTIKELIKNEFPFLTIDKNISNETKKKAFSTSNKSAIYIRDAINSAPKCQICHCLIHKNSISIDHKQRKQDGGLGTIDNGQLAHPYCNTGYKN